MTCARWRTSLVVVGLLSSSLAAAGECQFQGRLVQDVLREFHRDGYALVYSSDLVKPRLRFPRAPGEGAPIDRLKSALADIGLTLKAFPETQAWLVVRLPDEVQPHDPKPERTHRRQPHIEEVLVTSSRHVLKRNDEMSRHSLAADELGALPELGDDALRAVNHLPGTASLGVSARPHVRGGALDETLVLFDEVELLEPFHLKDFEALFSTFNPALIKRIDVYTGGFPARYGERMSGVMDIQPVDDYPPFGLEATLSVLTTAAAAYGHSSDRQWALSARRGNLDLLTRQVNADVGEPSYSDWMGQLTWFPDEHSEVDLGFLLYRDDVELKDLEAGTGELARAGHDNAYLWAKYERGLADGGTGSGSVVYSRVRNDRGGFSSDGAADEAFGVVDDRRRFDSLTLVQRLVRPWRDRAELEIGVRAGYQTGSYRYQSNATLGDLATLIGSSESIQRLISRDVRVWNVGGFFSARGRLGRFGWEAGARLDYQQDNDNSSVYISPRLQFSYAIGERTDMTFASGRYYQPEAITELDVPDGRTRFQSPQHADHFVAGINHRFKHPGWRLTLETFFKRVQDPKARYENLFNRLVLLPEIKPDRVLVDPEVAYARGVEMTLAYNPDPDLNVWLSYTTSRAQDRVGGHTRRRAWDQRQTVHAGLIWNRDPYSLSAALTWHSGWQTTRLPTVLDDLQPLSLRHNADDLPEFYSLNLRASREWSWPRQSLSLFFEVTNATNRDNVGGLQHELEPLDDGGYVLVTDKRTLLPLVPSIGVNWKFR